MFNTGEELLLFFIWGIICYLWGRGDLAMERPLSPFSRGRGGIWNGPPPERAIKPPPPPGPPTKTPFLDKLHKGGLNDPPTT